MSPIRCLGQQFFCGSGSCLVRQIRSDSLVVGCWVRAGLFEAGHVLRRSCWLIDVRLHGAGRFVPGVVG